MSQLPGVNVNAAGVTKRTGLGCSLTFTVTSAEGCVARRTSNDAMDAEPSVTVTAVGLMLKPGSGSGSGAASPEDDAGAPTGAHSLPVKSGHHGGRACQKSVG